MARLSIACALLLCLLAACGKKSAETSGDSPAGAAAQPTPANPPAPGGDATADASAATLERLTQTLRKFSAENQRVPKALKELVDKGYLPELPAPPAGRKFVINEKRVSVELSAP